MGIAALKKTLEILLADDNPGDVRLTQEAFRRKQIPAKISVARDGEDAMAFLRRQGKYAEAVRPNLILLDLNMPRKDGREALREIKSDPNLKRIPVIVLTTSKADTDISKIYELGANSFISKPVSFDSLVEVMKILGRYWFEIVELPAKKP